MITENLLKRYERLKTIVVDRKEQWDGLMTYLEEETDWLDAPASTKYHLCKKHGLLEHSVNVAETLLMLKTILAPEISNESCVICGLLHDLGKAGMPGKPQYLLNEPSLKQKTAGYPASIPYRWNTELTYLSIPVRSLFLIRGRFPITDIEAQAIIYHDGQYVKENAGVATHEERLTLLLQYADNWSGFVIEAPDRKAQQG